MGVCPRSAGNAERVLISPTPADHGASVTHHAATRALLGMKPARYVIPAVNERALRKLFEASGELDGCEHPHAIETHGPGDTFSLDRDLVVRPFFSPHRVPCQGYALW